MKVPDWSIRTPAERLAVHDYWTRYGLFPLGGMDTVDFESSVSPDYVELAPQSPQEPGAPLVVGDAGPDAVRGLATLPSTVATSTSPCPCWVAPVVRTWEPIRPRWPGHAEKVNRISFGMM